MRSLILFLLLATTSFADVPAIRGLSRSDLLEYHAPDGGVKKARTADEWKARRAEALQAFQKVAGPLPGKEKRCALDVKIDEEADCGTYIRRAITYASEPGSRALAYLCIPKKALAGEPAAAVLCLHPTSGDLGNKVVVGLGGKANRQYASELAERGFVTISPCYVQMGGYNPDLKALGYQSGTMKAVWDNIRALDLLDTLPFVRRDKGYATIGHSLGGHNSIYTAVLDERLTAIVSSCGFDSFLDYYGGKLNGWTQERYMPRMADYLGKTADVPFDFYELAACLAPRRFFVCAPVADHNFVSASVDRIVEAARPVFALHSAAENIRVVHPEGGHDFPEAARFESYAWIESTLK